jgi:hypothetical protein
MLLMIVAEILVTCWMVILPSGDAFCYCEGENPPPVVRQVERERAELRMARARRRG